MLLPDLQMVCRERTFGGYFTELRQLDFTLDILVTI
jgi:hypothetical protein